MTQVPDSSTQTMCCSADEQYDHVGQRPHLASVNFLGASFASYLVRLFPDRRQTSIPSIFVRSMNLAQVQTAIRQVCEPLASSVNINPTIVEDRHLPATTCRNSARSPGF